MAGSDHEANSRCAADEGYDIDYLRVPVTDEKAPKEADFALLLQRLWNAPEDAALVFNCQMGRGRTTTGMIIASLLRLKRASPTLDIPSSPAGIPTYLNDLNLLCVAPACENDGPDCLPRPPSPTMDG